MKLTDEEKAIWISTYAATFAELRIKSDKYTSAQVEFSIDAADDAVRGLKHRRESGRPNAGQSID